jgi:hypothetical protein
MLVAEIVALSAKKGRVLTDDTCAERKKGEAIP